MKVPAFKCVAVSVVIAFALPSLSVAQTIPRSCINNDEAAALVTYVLPATVRALSERCAQSLPATSALVQAGAITAARYQVDADRAWPDASRAFDKISGLPASNLMGEQILKPLVEKAISGEVTRYIKLSECQRIDRMINILQPLPAKNMAMLVVLLIESASPKAGISLPMPLCSVQSAAPAKGNVSK